MSDQYTPTTVEVRFAYTDRRDFDSQIGLGDGPGDEEAGAEFDRWLASVKAEAWDEGHSAGETDMFTHYMHGAGHPETPNPYRKETP